MVTSVPRSPRMSAARDTPLRSMSFSVLRTNAGTADWRNAWPVPHGPTGVSEQRKHCPPVIGWRQQFHAMTLAAGTRMEGERRSSALVSLGRRACALIASAAPMLKPAMATLERSARSIHWFWSSLAYDSASARLEPSVVTALQETKLRKPRMPIAPHCWSSDRSGAITRKPSAAMRSRKGAWPSLLWPYPLWNSSTGSFPDESLGAHTAKVVLVPGTGVSVW
mmetsp:Transcript_16176/g.53271  ORF Transcript_16176/g.53271 Transcript_16176/m.53271 type:complete len:223 (+) Transcript_16176:700-1368(+)